MGLTSESVSEGRPSSRARSEDGAASVGYLAVRRVRSPGASGPGVTQEGSEATSAVFLTKVA